MSRLPLVSWILAIGLASSPSLSAGQGAPGAAGAPPRHQEEGRPFIRNYPPPVYQGGAQNWALVQAPNGVMYVGSSNGILEYDGVTWRTIITPGRQTVRSLALTADGTLFAGSVAEFGYLQRDQNGGLTFVSLLGALPPDAPQFGDVWRTFDSPDGVYFQSEAALFRYKDGAMRVWKAAERFNRSSYVDGKLYVPQPGQGLTVLEGDQFRTLPGTSALGSETYPIVLRYDEGRLLIGTRQNGLFLYDGAALTPFITNFEEMVRTAQLYRGFALPGGRIALTSTTRGVVIMDRQGRELQVLNRQRGLLSDQVYAAEVDREGGLWLASNSGLARVDTPSPASFLGEPEGVVQGPNDIHRYRGRLHTASNTGAFYLEPTADAGELPRLLPIRGVKNQCWSYATVGDEVQTTSSALLLACSDGLFEVRGDLAIPIRAPVDGTFRAAFLLSSAISPGRAWIGLFDGFASIRRRNGQWIEEGRVPGIVDQVRSLVENPDGSLWLGTQATGVLRLRFDEPPAVGQPRPEFAMERFGVEAGFPAPGLVFVSAGPGGAYFANGVDSTAGVFRFDESTRRMVRDPAFDPLIGPAITFGFGMQQGPDGRLFVNLGGETAVMRREPDGTWSIDRDQFLRYRDEGPVTTFDAEPDGVVWMSIPPQPAGSSGYLGQAPGAAVVWRAGASSHGQPGAAALRRRRSGGRATGAATFSQRSSRRVRSTDVPRRGRDPVSIEARRPRRRLVAVEQ